MGHNNKPMYDAVKPTDKRLRSLYVFTLFTTFNFVLIGLASRTYPAAEAESMSGAFLALQALINGYFLLPYWRSINHKVASYWVSVALYFVAFSWLICPLLFGGVVSYVPIAWVFYIATVSWTVIIGDRKSLSGWFS